MELQRFIQSARISPKSSSKFKTLPQRSTSQFHKPPLLYQPFNKIPLTTETISWNGIIQSHLSADNHHLAVLAYRQMLLAGVLPDRHSLPRAIASSRLASALFVGQQLHCHAIKLYLSDDSYVLSALIELYAHFHGAKTAASLLSKSNPQSSISSYTLLAKLFLTENNPDSALHVFYQLIASGIELDGVAVATAAKACGKMKSVRDGKKIHEVATEKKLDCNVLVTNSLLKMYVECGRMAESRALFDSMTSKDGVSWTTLINSYVQNGEFNEGLKLFRAMIYQGVKPDEFSVSSVLPACSRMAASKNGREVHGCIIRQCLEMNTAVQNSLIDMYAKSGSLEIASMLFERMPERDAVSFTVMIMAYSLHGHGERGVALFHEIQKEAGSEHTDVATYAAALHACGTACMVDEGEKVFTLIGIKKSEPEHIVLMTRLLARSGQLVEAQAFVDEHSMAQHPEALRAVLDGCRIHLNARTGRRVAEQLIELDPLNAENYMLLSNMYAATGKWSKVKELREMIVDMGLKPKKACSWIEVCCKIHTFGTGDVSHPRSQRIYWELKELMKRMEEEGYVPLEDFSFHDVDEERECIPSGHSEMLAIAFGLLSTKMNTAVRVTKNMRVCRNCHESAKMVSRIARRDIVLRDPKQFHHFVDGSCSCLDVW